MASSFTLFNEKTPLLKADSVLGSGAADSESKQPSAPTRNTTLETLAAQEFKLTETDISIGKRTYFHQAGSITRKDSETIVEEVYKNTHINTGVLIPSWAIKKCLIFTCYSEGQIHEYFLSPQFSKETEQTGASWNDPVAVAVEEDSFPAIYDSLNVALTALAAQHQIKKMLTHDDIVSHAPEFTKSTLCFNCVIL